MRKYIIVLILMIIFILGTATTALASGYRDFDAGTKYVNRPHGGYSATTNLCKYCHAVHEAQPGYKLLRGPDLDGDGIPDETANASNACDFCHVGAGAHSDRIVYGRNPLEVKAEHTIGATTIPDSTKAPISDPGLICSNCHAVHSLAHPFGSSLGAMYRYDPYGDGGAALNMNEFCADCHDKNYDTQKNQDSHVMKVADGTYAWAGSDTCRRCHIDEIHQAVHYAFLGVGRSGQGAQESKLDDTCLKCHLNADETAGVGKTF